MTICKLTKIGIEITSNCQNPLLLPFLQLNFLYTEEMKWKAFIFILRGQNSNFLIPKLTKTLKIHRKFITKPFYFPIPPMEP